jgi:hypothetical protein
MSQAQCARWIYPEPMALLARFGCGCTLRVEIPAPPVVVCALHGATARLITTPGGQVRYVPDPVSEQPPRPRP